MQMSIEKSWHGLHFLLCGAADEGALPASFLLAGGSDIGLNSRIVSPAEALRFGEFVNSLSAELLLSRYDPAAMEKLDIYPSIIWQREGQEAFDWLLEYYDRLVAFFRDTAEEGHGYVITIA